MNVDTDASPAVRKQAMQTIIEQVVDNLDASPSDNVKSFLLHVGWHEGAQLLHRTQIGGGPGRSFFQFEPPLAKDAVAYAKQKGWLGKLAEGTGHTEAEIESAGAALPTHGGLWNGSLMETLLTSSDLFGTYLCRIALRKLPSEIPAGVDAHAEYWAAHWKRVFDSDNDRLDKKAQFVKNANEVDSLRSG